MLGDGIVSLGVPFATERRNVKSSAKMHVSSFSLPVTRMAAGVNSMSPFSLWNWTFRLSCALVIPPIW